MCADYLDNLVWGKLFLNMMAINVSVTIWKIPLVFQNNWLYISCRARGKQKPFKPINKKQNKLIFPDCFNMKGHNSANACSAWFRQAKANSCYYSVHHIHSSLFKIPVKSTYVKRLNLFGLERALAQWRPYAIKCHSLGSASGRAGAWSRKRTSRREAQPK